MKTYILPLFVIASLSLASCRKERTCDCDITYTTNGQGISGSISQTVGHANKREAKRMTNCYSFTTSETETFQGTVYNTETKYDCKLK